MSRAANPVALAVAALLGLSAPAVAAAASQPAPPPKFVWPVETSRLLEGPGVEHARMYCLTCHSADYITTQPRGMGEAFWDAEVTKMRRNYGAPVPEAETKAIVAYLAAAYATNPPAKPPPRRKGRRG